MCIRDRDSKMQHKEYHVPALEKGMAILEYLVSSGDKNLNQICADLSISRTTAFSLLKNMVGLGYLENDSNGQYHPTLKLFSLGMQVQQKKSYSSKILPVLSSLRDDLKATIHLSTYVGDHSVLLYKPVSYTHLASRIWTTPSTPCA